MSDAELRETLVARRKVFGGRYIEIVDDQISTADGARHERVVVLHPGAVAMVPLLADNTVLLVRQWRHAIGGPLLEIPAGTLDRDATGLTEEPALAAARELGEETGYVASTWRPLGSFYTAPGFASEHMFLYLATGLTQLAGYSGPPPDERLELVPTAWADAMAMAHRGEIVDAKTLLGLLLVDELLRAGSLKAS